MHGGVLVPLSVCEHFVDVGVRLDGSLQRVLVGVPQGELQSLVGVGLRDEGRSGWRTRGVGEEGDAVWVIGKGMPGACR